MAEPKQAKRPTGKPTTTGIHTPVRPSPELAAIVGEEPLSRREIISKLWDYIKKNELQDARDRRQINADEKLQKVFGKKSVSMFEMNKHISVNTSGVHGAGGGKDD